MTRTALYRHYDAEGALLYVGVTAHPSRREKHHAAQSAWHCMVAQTETEWCLSRDHALALEAVAIKHERPRFNIALSSKAECRSERRNLAPDGREPFAPLINHMDRTPGRSRAEWADAFGISRPHLYALLDGARSPSFDVARRIERATNGRVPVGAWPNLKAIADAVHGASSADASPTSEVAK